MKVKLHLCIQKLDNRTFGFDDDGYGEDRLHGEFEESNAADMTPKGAVV